MLLSEQLRVVKDEEVLASGATDWDLSQGWKDKKIVNVTLTATKIVYVWMKTEYNGNYYGIAQVLLDGVAILSTGYFASTFEREIFLVLTSGSYTIKFQTAVISGSSGTGIRLQDTKVALLNFPDKQRNYWDSGNVSIPAQSEATTINQNFTVPSTRKLAVGQIKKYVCIVTLHARGVNNTETRNYPINPGDSPAADWYSWKIFVDDAQVSWTERRADRDGADHTAPGCYGRYVFVVNPSTQYNLKIKCYNNYASQKSVYCHVDVILCPWILADVDYEPVSLDFPQGSTLYVFLEPLGQNPTKYVRVGKQRFMSFGDSTDYYDSLSGTGILSFDYTFETVEVVNSILNVKGFGGCVSILGVDVR